MGDRLCISDRKDLDGVGAAALVKRATGARCLMATNTDLWKALVDVSVDDALEHLYVCDFGLSTTNYDRFADLAGLICERAKMTYIDHHTIDASMVDRLRGLGMVVEHSERECSAVLAYRMFHRALPAEASFLAACAAITDYKDDGPLGAELIKRHDRLLVMYEATTCNQHIDAIQGDDAELSKTVEHLSKMTYPHQIPNAVTNATARADLLVDAVSRIPQDSYRMTNLAYMESETNSSGLANSVLGMSGKRVAVVYRTTRDGWHLLSVRGRTNIHLGRLVDSLAGGMGGRGGGHKHACGAVIPPGWLTEFLTRLDGTVNGG